MNTRIPSSINWLAKKYQTVKAELSAVETEILSLEGKRDTLTNDLESLERVISMHEVPILAHEIISVRKNNLQAKLKYGSLTRAILGYLKSFATHEDANTTEVCFAVIQILNIEFSSAKEVKTIKNAVRKRLCNLASEGQVVCTLKGSRNSPSRYRLPQLGDQKKLNF
ncbi:hypothetical protein [Pseudoalteromonas piscicida]|uniref:hypothetical protein n=1 Tax=Pseudoalteromonas piscicida TaxID=43662 RepID=UPI000E358823|nr:hypothetical protein [Pseudoalteromonas piscicida]AXQ98282.1 hypothetical protein D0N37_11385 [Pseudoalteromonas piscicida]